MAKTVLITGASGCIGHYIVDELLRSTDHELVLVLRDPAKLDGVLRRHDRVTVVVADVRATEAYSDHLERIDTAILAAAAWGGEATFAVNRDANLELARRLAEGRCQAILYFATASVLQSDGSLRAAARDMGTEYIRSKYQLVEAMEALASDLEIIGLFPTLVLGGSREPSNGAAIPLSHLAHLLHQVRPWVGLLRFFRADGWCHFVHAQDIAVITRFLLDLRPDEAAASRRLLLGNPAMSVNQIIADLSAHLGMRIFFRIPLGSLIAETLIWLFRIRLSEWDRFCLRHRDQSYREAKTPANFGLPVFCPDLRSGLGAIGLTSQGG